MPQPTLLVLAAGMGSRFGGLKQLAPIGPNGETILDYTIFDALRDGFGKVVFVIRRGFETEFREAVGFKYEPHVDVRYVFQEIDALPDGFDPPEGREKPWGTGHAILVAAPEIEEPFAAVNGDDFYGRRSIEILGERLRSARDGEKADYCMAAFRLNRTLSPHGDVSRGICEVDENGLLRDVVEHVKIVPQGDDALGETPGGAPKPLPGEAVVSMNLWGFTPSIFAHLKAQFVEFLRRRGGETRSEFYIPSVVNRLIKEDRAEVRVLPTPDAWLGVTYQEDMPAVVAGLRMRIAAGDYPEDLAAALHDEGDGLS